MNRNTIEKIFNFLNTKEGKEIPNKWELIKELETKTGTLTQKGFKLLKDVSKNKASSALFGGMAAAGTGEAGLTERQPIQEFQQ